ncbi:hypothetical protein ASD04_12665 [Devosia sp. Root436]|uniref:transketolase family protein n=1 Tax=Devosia sp. Root436 TaxID=1736537 RepID=UPI0006F5D50B|nr:transketolase C-terminal domain-containing protein [Devosia sp. Root436]KQX35637.1 hypothetical protein ASD04_12665 [Devosia sp. Root436]
MRDAFVAALVSAAQSDEKILLVTGDLGFGTFDPFVKAIPERFINVGVAEQNMIGVSTGLGLEGYKVFAYSIGNFSTLRCLEQIRNDAAYHEANLTIIGSGGGFTYGALGMSHHATEDLSILRALPGITVVAPCDAWETTQAVTLLAAAKGVSYLRIEKQTPLRTGDLGIPFVLGKARRLREGRDITIIGSGGVLAHADSVAQRLAERGLSARVVSMHTLKPLDDAEILDALRDTRAILTIEENTILGGLGGAVAEVIAESGRSVPFRRLGMQDVYSSVVGSQDYLRQYYGMGIDAILDASLKLIARAA